MNGEGRLRKAAAYAAWGCAAAASVALLAWTRRFDLPWFIAAAVLAAGAAALMRLGRGAMPPGTLRPLGWGLLVLAIAFAVGGYGLQRFRAIEFDWDHVVAEWERRVSAELHQHMTRVVERGRRAAELAAALASDETSAAGEMLPEEALRSTLFRELDELRAGTQVDALAVFTDAGDLFAWAGDHRGQLPEQVRMNPSGIEFAERPLYSYLYFTAPVKGRDLHVVSAVQVETGLVGAAQDAESGVTDTFAARTDVRAIFRSGPGRGGGVVWSLAEAGDTVVHARIERITQSGIRTGVEAVIRRSVVLISLGALLLLSIGWARRVAPQQPPSRGTMPLVVWVAALTLAPLGAALGLNRLLGPSAFVLPIPGDITLGTLLALLLPLGALVATIRYRPRAERAFHIALAAGVLAVAVAYPLFNHLLLAASTPPLLEGGARLWLGLQFAGTLLLAVVTALALPRRSMHGAESWSGPAGRRRAALVTATGVVLAGVLSITLHAATDVAHADRVWPLVLWVAPFTLCAVGLASMKGRSAMLERWLVAGWLGATAVLPGLWTAHQSARLASATRDLQSLGAQPQPILDYLLVEFANETARRERAGEQGVQLLYRSWVASGLAEEPYAARITLWSPEDAPEVELTLGGAEIGDTAIAVVRQTVENARDDEPAPLVRPVVGLQDVAKILTAPLDSGRMLSVALPPRRSIERTSMVAPFLGASADEDVRLNLIEATGESEVADTVRWMQSGEGWQSELLVRFPEGDYHAHMEVRVPAIGMQLARGTLLIAFDLALVALLWALGGAARGATLVPRGGWRTWAGSFRARVTFALFLFFVAPTVLFGWVAFQASAREVERTARALADRAVRQAVIGFVPADGHLPRLATLAGTEILRYYTSGELAEASSPEALELGVYGAWMDPELFRMLRSGEVNTAQDVEHLGENSFILAYHRLSPAGMLAAPMSLSAGDAAIRQRELAHLVVFAVVIGGLLSLALSVLVGRQLARPIGRLRRAATAVGEGHLRVRLPEPQGEFGQLFAAFNRMTRRLRRARAQELRTARVLAWGEMARQIAHEIKNPLTPIKLSVQHLRRAYNDRHPDFRDVLNANVEQILVEIDRLTEIARAFSRYGAPDDGAGPLTAVDVAGVVHDAITLYRAGDSPILYGEHIEPGIPRVQARSGELKEVLLNLLENARAALDGGGRIDVSASSQGERVELAVRDDGAGIPPDLLPRIFDPHFSTRSAGTGLGLAIVRRIVESWGGTVTAESEVGKGTVVRMMLDPAPQPHARTDGDGGTM